MPLATHRAPKALPVAAIVASAVVVWLVCRPLAGLPWRTALVATVLVPTVLGVWLCRRRLAASPARALLAVALPLGVALCAVMPPIVSVSWDGYVHYRTANRIAQTIEGDWTTTKADKVNYDADGIYDVGLYPRYTSDDDWHPNWATALSEEARAQADERFAQWDTETASTDPAPLSFAVNLPGRVPNALGLLAADLFGVQGSARLFMGRLSNLLCYVAIMVLAIRRLERGGWILMAFALTPTMMFMACNYSYDPFSIAMVALGAASFVGERQRPDSPLTLSGAAWMLVPFLLGTATKAVFAPCIAMYLFMPRSKFDTDRGLWLWRGTCVAAFLALVASFALPFAAAGGESAPDYRGGSTDIDSRRQLACVFSDPLRFLAVMAWSLVVTLNPVAVFTELSVNQLYLPRPLAWPVLTVAVWALVLWAVVCDRGRRDRAWHGAALQWSTVVAPAVGLCLMLAALYLNFNDVGAPFIGGLQVRYLLFEMAPFLLVGLNPGPWPSRAMKLLEDGGTVAKKAASVAKRARPHLGQTMLWGQLVVGWAVVVLGYVVRF